MSEIKKVNLENIPKIKGRGPNAGKLVFDWRNSLGEEISFKYENVEGVLKILGYNANTRKLKVEYLNKVSEISTDSIIKCKLAYIVGVKAKDFRYSIGDILKDNNRNLLILDREYKLIKDRRKRYYSYKCMQPNCGYTGEIEENNLRGGSGCLACVNKIAALGINTIWDTDRWMCDLGVSEEDAKKYTHGSGEYIDVICPICKNQKNIRISEIYQRRTISCSCSKCVSFPERFMENMLEQLKIKFIKEYSPEWIKPKRYDFYLPEYNAIIETHGIQHYEDIGRFDRTLEEEQANDKYKKDLALKNGINEYIIIDCRYSKPDFIKNNILTSELAKLFNLSNIDWIKCSKTTMSERAREICELWKKGVSIRYLTKIFGMHVETIRRALEKGTAIGLCNYTREGRLHGGREVYVYKNDVFIYKFSSIKELARKSEDILGVRMPRSTILKYLEEEKFYGKEYKGYTLLNNK